MKMKFKRFLSGVMAVATLASVIVQPVAVSASELEPEEIPFEQQYPELKEVQDSLDPDEIVAANDIEIAYGDEFEVEVDLSGIDGVDESKMKILFHEAKNEAGADFDTHTPDTYKAVYILVFPEAYIPLEYLKILQSKAAKHNMVIIGGIEHITHNKLVYNLTATILPIKSNSMSYAVPFFHQKLYFSPQELKEVQKRGYKPAKGQKHTLFSWGDMYFVTYCCYELTSISLRHEFQGLADIVFGVEWNKDTYYFGNIMEALSRDIYCYCVQSNMSEYGDSRIIQPTKKDLMNILKVKGGINASVLIGEIDIEELRKHQNNNTPNNGVYKPLPAGWDLSKTNLKNK